MSAGLKNVCLTCALPGASRKTATSTASTTTVLAVDSTTPRRLLSPSSLDRRADRSGSPASGSPAPGWPRTLRLDRGDAGEVLQVLTGQLSQRAVALQRRQRLVYAGHQRVALGEQQAVVLAGGRELGHHDRVGNLGGDELGRRRIGDQRRDLLGPQRLLHVVERLEHLRRRRRLDLAVDELEAGRADLVAVDVALEVGGLVLGHDRAALQRDQGLLDVVVAVGEGDRLGPRRAVGDLVDVEVELLRPRRVGRVERLVGPGDLGLGEAELVRHRVGHGALVALPVRRLVVDEPRRVDRLVGRHRELALGEQLILDGRVRAGRGRGAAAPPGRGGPGRAGAAARALAGAPGQPRARGQHGDRGHGRHAHLSHPALLTFTLTPKIKRTIIPNDWARAPPPPPALLRVPARPPRPPPRPPRPPPGAVAPWLRSYVGGGTQAPAEGTPMTRFLFLVRHGEAPVTGSSARRGGSRRG